jgi:hypothetical protein
MNILFRDKQTTNQIFLKVHLGQAWKIEFSYSDLFTYHCLLGALLGRAWLSPDFSMLTREHGAYSLLGETHNHVRHE